MMRNNFSFLRRGIAFAAFAFYVQFSSFAQTNPTGAAQNFNVITLAGASLKDGDIDGGLATKGQLTLRGAFTLAGHTPGTFKASGDANFTALIAEGGANFQSGSGLYVASSGFAKLSNFSSSFKYWATNPTRISSLSSSSQDAQPRIDLSGAQSQASINQDVFDFDGAFASFKSICDTYKNCTSNINLSPSGSYTFPVVSGKTNFFRISASALNSLSEIKFSIVPSATNPVVINVNLNGASAFTWSASTNFPGLPSNAVGQYVLFNFYNGAATCNVTLNNPTIIGTVFAPYCNIIKQSSSNIEGQVICNHYTHEAGEVHYQPFNTNINCGNVNSVTCNCAGNLLLNGGFEVKETRTITEDGHGYNLSQNTNSWRWSNGNLTTGSGFEVCDANNAYFQAYNSSAYMYQQVNNVVVGSLYSLGAYGGTHDPSGNHRYRLAFYKSDGTLVSTVAGVGFVEVQVDWDVDNVPVGQTKLKEYDLSLVAPAGASYLRVEGYASTDYLKLDNICLTVDNTCNNVTSGGTIGSNQTGCTIPFTPAKLTSTTLPSGGDTGKAIEYVWLKTTTLINNTCPSNVAGQSIYQVISGATSFEYTPAPVYQTTCYIRCARRAGCTEYVGESNKILIVAKNNCTVTACPNSLVTNGGFETDNGGTYGGKKFPATLMSSPASYITKPGNAATAQYRGALPTDWVIGTDVDDYANRRGAFYVDASVTGNAHSGDRFIWGRQNQCVAYKVDNATQLTGIQAGNKYKICAWLAAWNPDAGATQGDAIVSFEYRWRKADGTVINIGNGTEVTTVAKTITKDTDGKWETLNWQEACIEITAPVGAVGLEFYITPTDYNNGAAVDDVCVTTTSTCALTVDAGPNKTICNTDEVVLNSTVGGVSSCGTPSETVCATTIAASTGWIADLNYAKVCGDNLGAKLWTLSGDPAASSITMDLGKIYPAGTVIRVSLKLEHCTSASSTQSDAKIQASTSATTGFSNLASSLLFAHTSLKEYTYTLSADARYIKVTDNGKCAFRLDYVKATTAGTTSANVTYLWTAPATGGIVGANNTANLTVNKAGTYTLTVTDCNGCQKSDVVTVTANSVSANAGADQVSCAGENVTLTAAAVTNATYEWRSSTSATVLATTQSFTVTPTTTTDFILTVIVNGCSASDGVKVTVNPKPAKPVIVAKPGTTVCSGQGVGLEVSNCTGTLLWNVGQTSSAIVVTPTQTTTYDVTCKVGNCTSDKTSVTITVSGNCAPGKDPICISSTRDITNNLLCGTTGVFYGLWFNDLVSATQTDYKHFKIKTGTLTEYCDGTATFQYTACAVNSTTGVSAGVNDCITLNVNLSGRTANSAPYANTHCDSYNPTTTDWYYYKNVVSGTITGASGGIYQGLTGTYTQKDANFPFQVGTGANLNEISQMGASAWFTATITNGGVNGWSTASGHGDNNFRVGAATPIAKVTATANPTAICAGGNVTLNATLDAASKSASCTPVSYSWVGSNNFTGTGASITDLNVQSNTTYTVTVTIKAVNGSTCTITGTTSVTVNPNPTVTVDSKTICLDGTATLTASGCVGSVVWSGAGTGSGTTITVSPSAVGTYGYTATCTNSNNCKATATGVVTVTAKPTVSLPIDFQVCSGTPTTLTATGCAGGTLSWSTNVGGSTSATVIVTPTNTGTSAINITYTVTCTTSINNGCTATDAVIVTVNPLPTVTLTPTNITCNGAKDGKILATGNGGTPQYTFSLNGGAFTTPAAATNTFTGLDPNTTYTITVKDTKGCIATSSAMLTQPAVLAVSTTKVDPKCEKSDGSINLTVSGGTSPYTYLWSNGSTTEDLTARAEGTYSVTVTDKNGCTATTTVALTPQDCSFDLALKKVLKTAGTYKPGDNVTFTISVINQGTVTATNVQVTDYIPTGLTLSDANWTATSGKATLNTVIPTIAPGTTVTRDITFKIDANYEGASVVNRAEISAASNARGLPDKDSKADQDNTNDRGGLVGSPADDYVDGTGINGTGAVGDGVAATDEDDEDPALLTITQTFDLALRKTLTSAATVVPGSDVTFEIEVFNQGTLTATNVQVSDYIPAGLSLSPSETNWNVSGTIATLKVPIASLAPNASIKKTILLRANNVSTYQGQTLVNRAEISSPAASNNALGLNDKDSTPDAILGNDKGGQFGGGSLADDVITGNGTGAVGDGVAATDEDDEDPAGVKIETFDLALKKTLNSSTQTPIVGGRDVKFDITVINQGTIGASGIKVVDYIPTGMTLNDANWTATGGVATYNGPIANLTASGTGAGSSTVISITLKVNEGVSGPLSNFAEISEAKDSKGASVTDIDSTPDASNTNDGTVKNDETGENGKTGGDEDDHDIETITVEKFDLALKKTIAVGQPLAIMPGSDVKFTITVYNQGTVEAKNIQVTDYIPTGMTLNDANWNSTLGNTVLNIPIASLLPTASATVNITLKVNSDYTGTLLVNTAEISAAKDSKGNSVDDIDSTPDTNNGNQAGEVSPQMKDDAVNENGKNGGDEDDHDFANVDICQVKLAINPNTIKDVSCFGGNDGSATVTASGGQAPYTYLWSNGATTATVNNFTVGTYSVTVTDARGCYATTQVTIKEPKLLIAVATSTAVACYGEKNGTATVVASDGNGGYSYTWNSNPLQTSATATNLGAGIYIVTVKDIKNCTATASVVVKQPTAALTTTPSGVDVKCYGDASGSASVVAAGGTSPYTYKWSNNATTSTINGLIAGTYTVVVTDANSCTATASVLVKQPTAALTTTPSGVDVKCYGDASGSASVVAAGGTSPYTYKWSNNATTSSINNLVAGTYTVVVTDANSCTATASVVVKQPTAALTTTPSGVDVKCYGDASGSASVVAAGGTSPYTYKWSNNATTSTINGLIAGTYTVVVTDANSCTATASVVVKQPTAALTTTPSGVDVKCYGDASG
ncbi:collagen-binding domain-containing protein, partial [Emticicia sp. W12TSBA100-4]|uniref:collagen-binding domain-containing protein n=2 Tax=Emticicia sp. W12TSBA100-4 TaxID=3160965 RepID=UPI00330639D4